MPRIDVDKPAQGFNLKAKLIVAFRSAKGCILINGTFRSAKRDNGPSLLQLRASRKISELNNSLVARQEQRSIKTRASGWYGAPSIICRNPLPQLNPATTDGHRQPRNTCDKVAKAAHAGGDGVSLPFEASGARARVPGILLTTRDLTTAPLPGRSVT